jgi:hypothetical protein
MEYYIAFWNVENLFDTFDSTERPDWLQKALKKELEGWDGAVLDRKLDQLGRIIRQMNHGLGPDLLGLCEIENRPVLTALVNKLAPLGRNYGIAHHDTSDQRGIDVGFVYDQDMFSAHEQFFHVILKRTGTRDLFQVNFWTQQDNLLILIGNHWPSRSDGQYESEPYRILAGETLSYWASRIEEIKGTNAAVVVMGDFNDEPFNRSVAEYALSGNSLKKILNSQVPRFYNLMWKFAGQGIGTFYYDNFPNVLDQFWVSRGLLVKTGILKAIVDSVLIERFPDMIASGEYQIPRKFSRPSAGKSYDPNGFSDHFPIALRLVESP